MDNGRRVRNCGLYSSSCMQSLHQQGETEVSRLTHQDPVPTRQARGPCGRHGLRHVQRLEQTSEDGASTSQSHSRLVQHLGQQNGDGAATSRSRSSRRRRRRIRPRASVDHDLPSTPHQLEPQDLCTHCAAFRFQYESPGFCCSSGEVKVSIHEGLKDLVNLVRGRDADSQNFRLYNRLFNNIFAFSSLGGHVAPESYHHIYVFKLHGQLYHYLPNLIPDQLNPRYLQLYFYDTAHEHEIRTGSFPELRPTIVANFMEIMRSNPYAQFFRSLHNRTIDKTTTIRINKNPMLDQWVYNAPTSSEVAAILLDSSTSSESDGPYIVVSGRGNTSHQIMHYYGCYDPIQYPLLFPHGEFGWRTGLPRYKRNSSHVRACPTSPIRAADSVESILT